MKKKAKQQTHAAIDLDLVAKSIRPLRLALFLIVFVVYIILSNEKLS